jgi:uncharacterized protein YehS (DUF1456 family)
VKANDCLRRIRYILDLDDTGMIAVFAQAEQKVTRAQVSAWLKKEDDPLYEECSDVMFATFLNGLINQKRGKKDGPQPDPEKSLNNNVVFRKLKIAFDLKAEDILSILSLAELSISKHELSAFFRRADNRHYRDCKDQILRNFLKGMQIKYRGESQLDSEEEISVPGTAERH